MTPNVEGVPEFRKLTVVEHHNVSPDVSYSREIALMLYARRPISSIIVYCARPECVLSSIKKNWLHFIRKLEVEKAKTLDTAIRQRLDNEIGGMREVRFVVSGSKHASSRCAAVVPMTNVVHLVSLDVAVGLGATHNLAA